MMVKKILITGASGLLGGILVEHLSKNPNYDVYGMDKHIGLSVHYQIENIKASDGQQPILPPKKNFLYVTLPIKINFRRLFEIIKLILLFI